MCVYTALFPVGNTVQPNRYRSVLDTLEGVTARSMAVSKQAYEEAETLGVFLFVCIVNPRTILFASDVLFT